MLNVEKEENQILRLKLSGLFREFPIASFSIRLFASAGDRSSLCHTEVKDLLITYVRGFVWTVQVPLPPKFIIHIDFLDLKTRTPNGVVSLWPCRALLQRLSATSIGFLGRMLTESIHTDITINTNESDDGSFRAHRSVLAAGSTVFRSMFSYNLKENNLSTIDISDMSYEACQAFLNFLYGTIKHEEFLTHRLTLLHAADKYDIGDLKQTCHDSLLEDIDVNNVLERLQLASLYQLPKLKTSCMEYLVKYGKAFDIRDDFIFFLVNSGERELVSEILHEVLNAWGES